MTGRLGSRVVVDEAAIPGAWVAGAACARPEHMLLDFTDDQEGVAAKRAVCTACRVFDDCHRWAMAAGTPGFAAGATAAERGRARRTFPIRHPR